MLFTIVSPYTVKIDAGNLHDAMKTFVKTYYHLKINDLIVKDYTRHYQANLKYLNNNGHRRVGVNFFPYNGVVNPGPLLTGNVLNYNPYPIASAVNVVRPIITELSNDEEDKKPLEPVKPSTSEPTTTERKFYMVSPVASPVLPTVPTAGSLNPFATRLVGTPVRPVVPMAPMAVPMAPMAVPMAPMAHMSPMSLSPVSPTVSLFGQRIAFSP